MDTIIYNCLIADDNMIERDVVELFLKKFNNLHLVASCSNGLEVENILKNEVIDIVFSDINMPKLSGLTLLKGLNDPPVFIFITSFADIAAESFNLDVIDFIVKPLKFERFFQAVNKAIQHLALKRVLRPQDNPINETGLQEKDVNHFFIRQGNSITRILYHDVLYIESMGDFSKIYTVNQQRFVTLVSLKGLEIQLPDSLFKRIHRQFIVNLKHLITISPVSVLLDSGHTVPVGTQYKTALINHVDQGIIGRNSK